MVTTIKLRRHILPLQGKITCRVFLCSGEIWFEIQAVPLDFIVCLTINYWPEGEKN